MKFKYAVLVSFALSLFAGSQAAVAQAYPVKPIRAIIPFSPGGGTDTLARIVLRALSDHLGQPIIIDNKAGAGGMVGWGEAARAPADGYTISLGANTLPLLGEMYDSIPFNPKTDFEFVGPIATVPTALVAKPSLPATNIKELQAYAKSTGGALAYGSPGVATPQHLAGALLAASAGLKLDHIPYKGSSNAITDVIGGHIPLAIVGLPQALQYANGGQLRMIGLASPKRSALAPEIPTIAESGLPGYESSYWWDIIVPRGTPPAVIRKLHDGIDTVLKQPGVRKTLLAAGYEPMVMGRDEYITVLNQDVAKWTKIIRDNKIKLQAVN